ncbi:Organic cation transporter-like protein, partial [Armadillidium vulgare]
MIPSIIFSGAFITPKVEFECNPPLGEVDAMQRYECTYSIEKNLTKELEERNFEVKTCTNWNFSRNQFGESLTSEFNLVCDLDYFRPMFQALYMFGSLFGSPINGILSDSFTEESPRWLINP